QVPDDTGGILLGHSVLVDPVIPTDVDAKRLFEQSALAAERRIQARPRHPPRRGQVACGGARLAVPPEHACGLVRGSEPLEGGRSTSGTLSHGGDPRPDRRTLHLWNM